MIEAPPSFKPAVKYSDISGLLVSLYTVKPLLSEQTFQLIPYIILEVFGL